MTAQIRIRILLAHHSLLLGEGVVKLLRAQPDFVVVHRISDLSNLSREVGRHKPDILLMDVNATGTGWVRTLRSLSQLSSTERTLLMTDELEAPKVLEAIELGVRGLLSRNAPTEMLFKSIRSVSAGEYWIRHERIADIMDYLRHKKNSISAAEPNKFGLTTREKDVIGALLTGVSNKEIAQSLGISSQAVRHHLCSIFKKLGVSDRLELGLFAMQHGICNCGEMAQSTRAHSGLTERSLPALQNSKVLRVKR